MNDLKTLKDFCEIKYPGDIATSEIDVLSYQIRQEAIKWVQHFDESLGAKSFIMHFFGLTEDDLK